MWITYGRESLICTDQLFAATALDTFKSNPLPAACIYHRMIWSFTQQLLSAKCKKTQHNWSCILLSVNGRVIQAGSGPWLTALCVQWAAYTPPSRLYRLSAAWSAGWTHTRNWLLLYAETMAVHCIISQSGSLLGGGVQFDTECMACWLLGGWLKGACPGA